MTQNYKRIAKNTMFLYFRMIIIMAINFYTVRVVLDVLGVMDFGLYNVVASFVSMMTFLNSTLASGTQRFLTFEIGKNDIAKLKQTFSTTLLLHIGMALLILIFGETVGLWFLYEKINIPNDRFDAVFWVYQFAIFTTMVTVTQVPYNALIIAHEKMHIFAYVSIIEVVLKLLIVYLLVVSSYDLLITYGILLFLVSTSIAMFYRWYVTKHYQESHFEYSFNKEVFKPILNFSGWSVFGTIGAIISSQGVTILLNIYYGPIANAAHAIALQVSGGLNQFVNNFQTAMTPQITKLYASNKIEEMNTFVYHNTKYAFLLVWLFALPSLIKLEYILSIWLNELPTNSLIFTKLLIIYGLMYAFMRPLVLAIQATGQVKLIQLSAGILLVAILPISYFLFEYRFPIYSPFIVMLSMWFLHFSLEIFFLRKYINFSIKRFINLSIIPLSGIILISSLISNYLSIYFDDGIISIIFFTFISIVINVTLAYFLAIDTKTRLKVNNKIILKLGLGKQ